MPHPDKNPEFGKRLQARRMGLGIATQEHLAGLVGTSRNSVSAWENGTIPRGRKLSQLAEVLQTSETWLLHGDGPATPVDALGLAMELVDAAASMRQAPRLAT